MAGRSSELPPIKIQIARDPQYSGKIKYNARSCDIAAPRNRNNTPWAGSYQLSRRAIIPETERALRDSYGPVVLYYTRGDTGMSVAIHGGTAPEPDCLFNPEFGLVMHDTDLQRLSDALMHDEASQRLEITTVDLRWWERPFRTQTVSRLSQRMSHQNLPTTLQAMKRIRRPQYGDDILEGNPHFWIAVHVDHQADQASAPAALMQTAGAERNLIQEYDRHDDGGLLAQTLGADRDADPDEEARTARARQFVFGNKPNLLTIGATPMDESGTASQDIDAAAEIMSSPKSNLNETRIEVLVDDPKVETSVSAPAAATFAPSNDSGGGGSPPVGSE